MIKSIANSFYTLFIFANVYDLLYRLYLSTLTFKFILYTLMGLFYFFIRLDELKFLSIDYYLFSILK